MIGLTDVSHTFWRCLAKGVGLMGKLFDLTGLSKQTADSKLPTGFYKRGTVSPFH